MYSSCSLRPGFDVYRIKLSVRGGTSKEESRGDSATVPPNWVLFLVLSLLHS